MTQEAGVDLQRLEKKLGKFIQKSQPYFEQKDVFNKALEGQKQRVQGLQRKVSQSKSEYSRSLRNLEVISESIHEKRKRRLLKRRPGVGADSASGSSVERMSTLPSFDLDECDVNSQAGDDDDDLDGDSELGERAAASGASSSARGSVDFGDEGEDVVDQGSWADSKARYY